MTTRTSKRRGSGSDVGTLPALVGGKRSLASSGETIEAINPATGELIARFPRCDREDVGAAVDAARDAAPEWRRVDPAERVHMVDELANSLVADAEQLALLDARDGGNSLRMLRDDVTHAVDQIRFFAGLATVVRGQTIPTAPDRLDYTLREPYGVIGRIIPFNHPLMFAASKIAAPLVAGNTVILKPSEHTSVSALRLADHLASIFPPGVVNIVTGLGTEAGDALVTHPEVRRLAFIGGAENGRHIQARAATAGIKTVTLELGGKNPLVVFPDADFEAAIDGAIRGMNFSWQGQSCGSTSRLLVHRSIHDAFVEQLSARITALRSGMPEDETTDTGAIVNRAQYDKVCSFIRIGHDEGARLIVGGHRPDSTELAWGLFIRPTVFADVDPSGRLAQEEIFGPVLAVMAFDDYDDALRIANGVKYGLTASVYTSDLATALAFARDVEAGYVWVNDSSRHVLGAPFGGTKASGIGREEGVEELESYTEIKNVHVWMGR